MLSKGNPNILRVQNNSYSLKKYHTDTHSSNTLTLAAVLLDSTLFGDPEPTQKISFPNTNSNPRECSFTRLYSHGGLGGWGAFSTIWVAYKTSAPCSSWTDTSLLDRCVKQAPVQRLDVTQTSAALSRTTGMLA